MEGVLDGRAAGESTPDDRTPSIADAHDRPGRVVRASLWGATAPWNQVVVTGLVMCLLFAPAVFDVDIRSGAADVAHIGGAFVVVTAVIAMGGPVRALRLLNVPAGLAIAGLVFLADPQAAYAGAVVTGLPVAGLSLRRGPFRESFGAWRRLTN